MEICPTHSLFLTISLIVFILPSLILVTAESLDYPSFAIPPASWFTGHDFISFRARDLRLKAPVLVNGNFTCGFHCEYKSEITCLFAISILVTSLGNMSTPNSSLIIWSANRNYPVGSQAVLRFSREGDLILEDGNGASIWSTNTTDMSVSRLSLTTQGNLVLLGKNNTVIWQSFDHPTDSLVPGQRLVPGKKLRSSISISDSSEGLYSLEIDDYGHLVAYMEADSLQPYYRSEDTVTKDSTGQIYADFGSIIKLDSDGHLKRYLWKNLSWVDVLDISACSYPLVCGKYGTCSGSGICSCYGEITDHLIPTDVTQPDLGCYLNPSVSCEFPHDQRLIQLVNHFFSAFTFASNISNRDEESCKQACLINCSCKAVIFQHDFMTNYANICSLASEVFSFRLVSDVVFIRRDVYDVSGFRKRFIKVQDSPVTKNLSLILAPPGNKGKNRGVIMGSTLGAIVVLLLLCSFGIMLIKKFSRKVDEDYLDHISGLPTRFSYDDLKVVTKNFSDKLGEGGFGSVFQGTLSSGAEVAVKHLIGFGPVNKSFITEVQTVGSIHHFNLVSLVGFCAENSLRLLVYEYMSNGSLDQWIFNKDEDVTLGLSWQSRKKIILDIAKGLAYLHEDCNQKIIHLDIKPQNILLDENFNAKVSDFGLSKLIGRDQSQVVTTMRGTPGYMAPEWLSSVITEKVDVYSFGIVVLEIVCGRPNVDRSKSEDNMHLVSLFKRKAEEEKIADLVDESNEDMQSSTVEVMEMMKVAACCLHIESGKRPSMSEVVKVLEGSIDNIEEWLSYDFSNLPGPEVAATVSFIQPSFLSGPR